MSVRANEPSRSTREDTAYSPVLWFAVWQRARMTADRALQRRARRALALSGIRVSYHRGRDVAASPLLSQAEIDAIAIRVAELLRGSAS
jgi:hypothetical protein